MKEKGRGFSTIESIVSLFLLSLLIIFSATIIPSSLRSIRKAETTLAASGEALRILALAEEIESAPEWPDKSSAVPEYSRAEDALNPDFPKSEITTASSLKMANPGEITMETGRTATKAVYLITYRKTRCEEGAQNAPVILADITVDLWWDEKSPSDRPSAGSGGLRRITYSKRAIMEKRGDEV